MSAGVPIQPKDSRGYYMLPQAPEDAGYYVYGNVHKVPGTGHLARYAHPNLFTVIFQIEREWQNICDRKFGIGNISIDGGKQYDGHKTHQQGIEMDCRPVRKDYMTGQRALFVPGQIGLRLRGRYQADPAVLAASVGAARLLQ